MKDYGIGIHFENKEDYCIPMDLKEIDDLFLSHSKEEILYTLKENDSILTVDDPNLLCIEKYVHGHWKNNVVPLIDDAFVLSFSMELLFQQEKYPQKILNLLYNHFRTFLNKGYIREEFKEAIRTMTINKEAFLEAWRTLNYEEQRMIRVYLKEHFDIHKIEGMYEVLEMDYPLKRKAN